MTRNSLESVPLPDKTAEVLAVNCSDSETRLLARIFRGSSWRLRNARGIDEALSLMRTHRFSVVIMDERVAIGSWKSLLAGQSGQEGWMPIIVASSNADERLWQEALQRGCFDVLSKPFDAWEVLWASFNAWLGWKNQFDAEVPLSMGGGLLSRPN